MIFMRLFSPPSTAMRWIARCVCGLAFSLTLLSAGEARSQSAVQGVPNAMQGFSQNRDQPIQIEAATLEMRDKKKEATFSGNVKVIQGDTTMTSKTLVVFYESSGGAPAAGARRALRRAAGQCQGRSAGQRRRRCSPRPLVPAAVRRSSGSKPRAMSL